MRYTILEELAREHELTDRLRRLRRELAALKESPEEYFVEWKSAGVWNTCHRPFDTVSHAKVWARQIMEPTQVISIHTKVHWRSEE